MERRWGDSCLIFSAARFPPSLLALPANSSTLRSVICVIYAVMNVNTGFALQMLWWELVRVLEKAAATNAATKPRASSLLAMLLAKSSLYAVGIPLF